MYSPFSSSITLLARPPDFPFLPALLEADFPLDFAVLPEAPVAFAFFSTTQAKIQIISQLSSFKAGYY